MPAALLIALAYHVVLSGMLAINSIIASTMSFVTVALLIWSMRPDLRSASVVSALLTGTTFFVLYQIMLAIYPDLLAQWCTDCNPTGMRIFGVNVEEVAWDVSWGLVGGTIYEAVTGRRIVRRAA